MAYESTDKMVSHPSHYASSNFEVIDIIEEFTADLKGIEATDTGNVIKYILRWNKKGKPIQDLEKAMWYLTHLIEHLKFEEEIEKQVADEIAEIDISEYTFEDLQMDATPVEDITDQMTRVVHGSDGNDYFYDKETRTWAPK